MDETHPKSGQPELKRVMGTKLLLLFIVGDILGTGVYALTGQVAGEIGGAAWAPILLAFGVATVTALSYLELVTKFPQAAGAALDIGDEHRVARLEVALGLALQRGIYLLGGAGYDRVIMDDAAGGSFGNSRKSDQGQASYYYSQPFFTATGSVSIDGNTYQVSGPAWLDR